MKLFGFLLLSQVLLLDPCVVLMRTKALDCDNPERFISAMICTPYRMISYSTSGPLLLQSPLIQILRPAALAVSLLHSIAKRYTTQRTTVREYDVTGVRGLKVARRGCRLASYLTLNEQAEADLRKILKIKNHILHLNIIN